MIRWWFRLVIAISHCFVHGARQGATSGFDKDPYKVLGVNRKSSQSQIKKAYREKARETHPDKNPGPDAEAQFRDVASAYELLSDDTARKNYDRHGHHQQQQHNYQQRQRQRQWQWQQQQQQHFQRRQESLQNAKYRRAQERVRFLKVSGSNLRRNP